MLPLKDEILPKLLTLPVDAVMCPYVDTISHGVVIHLAKVQSPFASSLHLTVHVEPCNVPTIMVPDDCTMVDTYRMSVLMDPKLAVLVVL